MFPLQKNGTKVDENNYRLIFLLNALSEIYENPMHSRLHGYFASFNLFYSRQYGFRKKHSTIDALVEVAERLRHEKALTRNTKFFS